MARMAQASPSIGWQVGKACGKPQFSIGLRPFNRLPQCVIEYVM
jgi:hypothetical protein